MWKPSFRVGCIVFLMVFVSGTSASVIPAMSSIILNPSNHFQHVGQDHQTPEVKYEGTLALPNSFALIAPEGMFASFENGTSLLRGKIHKRYHRVKRDACKRRPDTEVMEYYDLKLPNRCWDDCDCRSGRYCTTHSWCHDLPKQP